MDMQLASQIFKSDLRGRDETATYKCLSTFNYKHYQNEFRGSFGQLQFLNDEYLSPRQSISYTHEEDVLIFLLPIEGTLNYCSNVETERCIRSEQIKCFEAVNGFSYVLNNPYEKALINYLHVGFGIAGRNVTHKPSLHDIKFEKLNALVSLGVEEATENRSEGYIGIYQSRSKENYILKNSQNGIFVYVINGAFDVQGRLLEYRDGLSLWNLGEMEFEALSDNAIIIVFEINFNTGCKNINNN